MNTATSAHARPSASRPKVGPLVADLSRAQAAPPVLDQHGATVRAWLDATGPGSGAGAATEQPEPPR